MRWSVSRLEAISRLEAQAAHLFLLSLNGWGPIFPPDHPEMAVKVIVTKDLHCTYITIIARKITDVSAVWYKGASSVYFPIDIINYVLYFIQSCVALVRSFFFFAKFQVSITIEYCSLSFNHHYYSLHMYIIFALRSLEPICPISVYLISGNLFISQ